VSGLASLERDTIAAVATAPGRAGVGIIRVSGARALPIATAVCARELQPRHAHFCAFRDTGGTTLDRGIALYFPAPASFTGEDVTEFQAHGGPVILDLLLKTICRLGARLARPGEFSERAFLNDKIDLAQAEAIADLINSTTEQAARNASRSMQGAFSRHIEDLVQLVTSLRVYVEAAIDFPEEEIDFLADGKVEARLQDILQKLEQVLQEAKQGSLIQEGMKIVIAGKPNAGKSSLLNALSGQDTAIVTAIEGTTRDVLREHIQIDGMPLHVVDTAGLRDSGDEVEREGVRRALLEMASADRILLVVDGRETDGHDDVFESIRSEQSRFLPAGVPVTVIRNKCDLTGIEAHFETNGEPPVINLSAKEGAGLELLREHLQACVGYRAGAGGNFSARRRHLQALGAARQCLLAGQQQLLHNGAGELLAEDLRHCQQALGEITGAVTADELLGEIFSSFCIGK
jgi:tRNA modification GTPase